MNRRALGPCSMTLESQATPYYEAMKHVAAVPSSVREVRTEFGVYV